MRGCATVLLLALIAALGATPVRAEDWSYTVRPGDDLWTLASRYCGSPSFAPRIAAANGLGDQGLIRPGARLRIPVAWLVRQPVTAEVVAVRGAAFLLVPASRPARVGDAIEMGQRLRTDEGAAVVAFADGSTLQVSDHSEVLFNVLTAFGDTGMVDTNLRFYRGRATSRVQRRNNGSRFRISTPSGTAAVRGTEFRVGVGAERTLTETLEGEVGFRQDQEIALPAGTGLVASASGLLREPLLEAPQWNPVTGPVALGSAIAWQPVAGSAGYRVSVFTAADPVNPLREQLVDANEFVLDRVPLGPYQVAVRARSGSGLEGFDARLAIDVRAPAPSQVALAEAVRGNLSLSWQPSRPPYTVQVSSAATFDEVLEIRSDSASVTLPELPAGRYRWRVRDAASVYSAAQSVAVVPPPVSGLRGATDLRLTSVRWQTVADADGYRLALFAADATAGDGALRVLELTDSAAEFELPGYGRYRVEVTALENGLASAPAAVELQPQPRAPWWLLVVLLAGLLAL